MLGLKPSGISHSDALSNQFTTIGKDLNSHSKNDSMSKSFTEPSFLSFLRFKSSKGLMISFVSVTIYRSVWFDRKVALALDVLKVLNLLSVMTL